MPAASCQLRAHHLSTSHSRARTPNPSRVDPWPTQWSPSSRSVAARRQTGWIRAAIVEAHALGRWATKATAGGLAAGGGGRALPQCGPGSSHRRRARFPPKRWRALRNTTMPAQGAASRGAPSAPAKVGGCRRLYCRTRSLLPMGFTLSLVCFVLFMLPPRSGVRSASVSCAAGSSRPRAPLQSLALLVQLATARAKSAHKRRTCHTIADRRWG